MFTPINILVITPRMLAFQPESICDFNQPAGVVRLLANGGVGIDLPPSGDTTAHNFAAVDARVNYL